jgi:DNA repair protein RecO (recombination protein O)
MTTGHQPATQDDRRARLYRVQAIVLRRRNLGEADRILTLFTREAGKLRCVARAARRPGSKIAGHTEPYMLANLLIARTRGLHIVSQAEGVRSFAQLRESEPAIASAGLMAERLDRLTGEDQAQPAIFELFESALDLLDRGESPERVQIIFDVGLLREAGFRPNLESCMQCGAVLEPEPNGFRFDSGGVVCPRCMAAGGELRPISVGALKVLRLIDRGEIGRFLALRAPEHVLRETQALLSDYVAWITGRDSPASRVIRDLRLEYRYEAEDEETERSRGISG